MPLHMSDAQMGNIVFFFGQKRYPRFREKLMFLCRALVENGEYLTVLKRNIAMHLCPNARVQKRMKREGYISFELISNCVSLFRYVEGINHSMVYLTKIKLTVKGSLGQFGFA